MSLLASQLAGKAVSLNTVLPAATETTILRSVDVQRFDRFTIYVANVGGAAVETIKLQTSPTADGTFIDVDASVTGGAVANGVSAFESYSDKSFKFIRVLGTSAAGTTVSTFLSVGGLT
jgi:hypothetical protein